MFPETLTPRTNKIMQTESYPAPRYLYLFLGNTSAELDKKSVRFVVEVSEVPTATSRFAGKVVAVAKKSPRYLGETGSFCNPVRDAAEGMFPSFIRMPENTLAKMFPEAGFRP